MYIIPNGFNYFGSSTDISPDKQIEKLQEGTGFFYLDIENDIGKPVPIEFPGKLEKYEPVRLRNIISRELNLPNRSILNSYHL